MEKYKLEEQKAILTLLYNQGADQFFKEAKETKIYEKYKELKEFRKIIDQEAKKRKWNEYKLIDYFAENKKELLRLLREDKSLRRKIKNRIEEELIKVSIPSLEQKFAITKYKQLSIFDEIKDKNFVKKAKDLNIKIIGWDLSKAEDQAVFAIQKIYSKYNYEGNYNNSNALIFTPSEFYENFGVKKYIYRNKEIFSSGEKNQAYMALMNLSKIQCIMAYNIRDSETRKFNRIETLSPIIPEIDLLYTGLDKKDLDNGREKKKKLRHIKIMPSKVLLDQIEKNYYALLPSNLYLEIKEKFPKVKNKHLPNFIFWLAKTIALRKRKKQSNIIEIGFEKLSRLLRMDNWIKANQKNKIETRLKDCFKQTKVLGYLNWYRISRGKTVTEKVKLSININKFKTARQIKEIIDSSFKEEEHIEEIKDLELVKKQKERIRDALGIVKR